MSRNPPECPREEVKAMLDAADGPQARLLIWTASLRVSEVLGRHACRREDNGVAMGETGTC